MVGISLMGTIERFEERYHQQIDVRGGQNKRFESLVLVQKGVQKQRAFLAGVAWMVEGRKDFGKIHRETGFGDGISDGTGRFFMTIRQGKTFSKMWNPKDEHYL